MATTALSIRSDRWSVENLEALRERRKAPAVLARVDAPKVFRKLSDFQIKGAFFNPTELVIESGISEGEWMALGNALAQVCQSANWWCGDFIRYGVRTYGKEAAYDLAQQATGYTRAFLYRCASVATRFPAEKRLPELTFYHYMRMQSFPHDLTDRLLPEAAELGLTARQIYKMACEQIGTDPKKQNRFHRKKVIIHLWTETHGRLLARANGMKLSHFIGQILEEYLVGKPIERKASGPRTNAWREAVRES